MWHIHQYLRQGSPWWRVPHNRNVSTDIVMVHHKRENIRGQLKAGEFSWNNGIYINNLSKAHERKAPKGKFRNFFSKMLLKQQFNERFNPYINTIRVFFPKIGALLFNFQKRVEETSFHSPLQVAPLNISRKLSKKNNCSVCGPSLVLYLFVSWFIKIGIAQTLHKSSFIDWTYTD